MFLYKKECIQKKIEENFITLVAKFYYTCAQNFITLVVFITLVPFITLVTTTRLLKDVQNALNFGDFFFRSTFNSSLKGI